MTETEPSDTRMTPGSRTHETLPASIYKDANILPSEREQFGRYIERLTWAYFQILEAAGLRGSEPPAFAFT